MKEYKNGQRVAALFDGKIISGTVACNVVEFDGRDKKYFTVIKTGEHKYVTVPTSKVTEVTEDE